MCESIELINKNDNKFYLELHSLGMVKEYGWEVLPEHTDEFHEDHQCLCGVDLEGVLEHNKVNYERSVWGYVVDLASQNTER